MTTLRSTSDDIAEYSASSTLIITLLITLSGFTSLAWEVIWQLKASLALGVSSWGAAITLATMMGGMSLGGYLMGRALNNGSGVRPLHLYGSLELIIGISGLILTKAFMLLEWLDSSVYSLAPSTAPLIYLLGIVFILAIPTMCMGATIPVFSLVAKQNNQPISRLYSINTAGAALGALLAAFIIIPAFGVNHTVLIISCMNIIICLSAWLYDAGERVAHEKPQANFHTHDTTIYNQNLIVFATGFATLTLEIAWFRSLSNIFTNTTDMFAIMVACVLIAISLAAKDVEKLKAKNRLIGTQLLMAGLFILFATPLIERLDVLFSLPKLSETTTATITHGNQGWLLNNSYSINSTATTVYISQILLRFIIIYALIVPPIRLLATAFPWLLNNQDNTQRIGKLYAINTVASILGALISAWVLLPHYGFAKTAWFTGGLIAILGVSITPGMKRYVWAVMVCCALFAADYFKTDIGTLRAQGFYGTNANGLPAKLIAAHEGPQETLSVVEYDDHARALLINNAAASWESGNTIRKSIHYMSWMGHLPMLLHPDPKNALVICFGTGQTANAIRKENPEQLDIVDINPTVFKLAQYFNSNEKVLQDNRVNPIAMDGRAFLRRTNKQYDVITLEPMPPNTAGVNALYSREFYAAAKNALTANGIIAQWLPFHITSPEFTASIAKTFIDVFPNAILWIDNDSKSGILLGSNNPTYNLLSNWPGFKRGQVRRNLNQEQVYSAIALNTEQLNQYASYGRMITDDNQRLAYGESLYASNIMLFENFDLLKQVNQKVKTPIINSNYR